MTGYVVSAFKEQFENALLSLSRCLYMPFLCLGLDIVELYKQNRQHRSGALQHIHQTNAMSSETQQTWNPDAYNSHDLYRALIGCFMLSIIWRSLHQRSYSKYLCLLNRL